ncbi:hypothetical protein CKO25_12600 [Thiocapsa imhoffii]|uniref:CRISPR-associated protein Cas6 C-terminal domain-containing protein n=1 Tax=Thiocapsa imhoffii TaxID=382777 RepID=A0A9X1B943_9GAMM|nr:CRISPR system precrRNA processing endoribonuclease RAMP protein Cas6 [Thiocapsa imhoffii]MBK1645467.1 hypothetical protein [Thiocapsa imhoffii]
MTDAIFLPMARYRVLFETLETVRLLDYPGSTWRGAFGHALKEVACTYPGLSCQGCPDNSQCPYPPLFESIDSGDPLRPYIFEPQAFSGYFPPGAILSLDLVLLGWLNNWLPLLAAAMQRLGERGLGQREPAHLRLVDFQCQIDPNREHWISVPLSDPDESDVQALQPFCIPPAPSRARLDLITPLKLKSRGVRIQPDALSGRELLIALARRMEACANVLDTLPLTPEPDQWFHDCETLIEGRELAWLDTHHYSNRQREALKLGGLTGRLWLGGPVLARIWTWLWLGQWLHLGSSTTIGLGRYAVRAAADGDWPRSRPPRRDSALIKIKNRSIRRVDQA